ncbi:hypothetical protein [Thioclava sp. GXIMD2076]|uniref:helix-turn-helix transcriptional regulator n=1 Tax=Thioclava sp. GXIMD2076 TaxID=3131931 RepID=UPI0030CEE4A9
MASSEEAVIASLFSASSGYGAGEAAAPSELWSDFLRGLAQMTGADAAGLLSLRGGEVTGAWSWGGPVPIFSRALIERMRSGRIYGQSELSDLANPDLPLRALRSRIDATSHALVWIGRNGVDHGIADFRARDGVGLSRLAPYLGPALQSYQALRAERARHARDSRIARDLGGYWMQISPAGRVVAQSADLPARLEGTAMTLTEQGWLAFTSPDLARRFRARLAELGAAERPEAGGSAAGWAAFDLSDTRPLAMVLRMEEGAIMAYLRQPRAIGEMGETHLMQHYGLARSEARLAICLGDGLSLAEAGEALGWQRETARSYSKQLYAKLGVAGQSAVVRLLWSGGLWL